MAADSDLPPAYSSLQPPYATLNIDTEEEGESKCDDGAELVVSDLFEDKTTRFIFIQKVLTIKLLQLLGVAVVMGSITAAFVHCYHCWIMDRYTEQFIVKSILAYLVVFLLLICCDQVRRQKPYKYIFLVVCPLSIALVISSVSYWNAVIEVAMAWVYHCVAVFALLVYNICVMRTKFDFDTLHGFYITTGVQVVLYVICYPFVVDPLYVLYPTIVLALEHVYILFALKLMTSKNYKSALTPNDYVDAALNLHIDYIYIFNKYLVPMMLHIRTAGDDEMARLHDNENEQS